MKKKLFVTVFLIVALILSTFGSTFAANAFSLTITPDKTTVKKGESVKLTVALSNITATDGIAGISAQLDYDKGVFEEIEIDEDGLAENIESGKGWESVTYNQGLLTTNTASGTGKKTDSPVMTITLKVKSTAKEGATTVKISQIVGSDGSEDLETSDASAKITVGNSESDKPKNNTTENNTTENNTTENNTTKNNTTGNNTTKNNTTENNTAKNNTTENNTAKNNTTENNTTKNNTTESNTQKNNTAESNTNENKQANENTTKAEATSEKASADTSKNTNKSNNTNTNQKTLPYAGNNETLFVAILIIALVGGITFIRYKKLKNI